MRIVIVTVDEKCPAASALAAEGFSAKLVLVEDKYTYGETLQSLWREKETFINVEHDMAPWPGAAQALWSCTEEICQFAYPRASMGSLGMIKFSEQLIARFPHAADQWHRAQWHVLESAVLGRFTNVAKHLHKPDIAHLSGWFTR